MTDKELLSLCNEYLSYDPETGDICWVKKASKRTLIGVPIKTMSGGYLLIGLNKATHRQHRIAFLMHHGYLPEYIDHVNENKSDNRILNLRGCTKTQNQMNRGPQKNNTSGYKGVRWHKITSKWQAQITYNKKVISLGLFDCRHEAARAYNEGALKYHGPEFSYINIISKKGLTHG